jgi:ABC-type multidrug transport system fused ATPase/permease subunit
MTIGGLISFNQYSQKLFTPILKIVQHSIQLKKTVISINKVYGIFQDSQEVVRIKPYYDEKVSKGEIIFRDVYFTYDHKRNIYNGLNLHIIPGVFNGIVGESGGGKSTIINLLMRLWDVEKGEIVIDGVAIKKYQVDSLRKSIALVTQESFLVNDSIEKNLTLLNPDISMEKMVNATVKAGIFDYIDSLPEKFNTMVGENGIKLSGGQKQRIAIARILLQNAPIVILDEATAALDNNVEAHVIQSFYEVLSGKTVIVISHRLSIIKNCANINVIKQGKVYESGTHEQLMAYNQEYRRLYNKNFN